MTLHHDTTLACASCGQAFVFTAGEQELQHLRGVSLVPTHCQPCVQHLHRSGRHLTQPLGPDEASPL